MELFTQRHANKINGELSCFDRIIITGTIPAIYYADGMTGYPILEIRKLFRAEKTRNLNEDLLMQVLGLTRPKARRLLIKLETLGYIQQSEFLSRGIYSLTIQGNALAGAKADSGITRKGAEKIVAKILKRVTEVNANDQFAFRVDKVGVFGSYLTNKANLGDIDLVVSLEPREKDTDRQHDLLMAKIQAASQLSRRLTSDDLILWPATEVMHYLKGRSKAISMHTFLEIQMMNCEVKIIYSAKD